MAKTICLNMIVRNESAVIRSTLENVLATLPIHYWVIVDTGSTDSTKAIIQEFFDSRGIPGELHETPWKDFGFNRTDALAKAKGKTDYLLVHDADDTFTGTLNLPEDLERFDAYHLKIGDEGFAYKRLLLVNNKLTWRFRGVLHEFIQCDDPHTVANLDGSYRIVSGRTGARSQDPDKYLKDALLLEKAFEEDKDLQGRYAFYCGQSYKDCGMEEKAIYWYKKRGAMKGWVQETYISYYEVGNMYRRLGQKEHAVYYWMLAHDADPERCEALYRIVNHFREEGFNALAVQFYDSRMEKADLSDKLFVYTEPYTWQLAYEFSILAFYEGRHKEGVECYKKLFPAHARMPLDILVNIMENFDFYLDRTDPKDIGFLELYTTAVRGLWQRAQSLSPRLQSQLSRVVQRYRPHLGSYPKDIVDSLKGRNADKRLLITITTCRRLDLFLETMNSFLRCCKDILGDVRPAFLCVDDNSSDADRDTMRKMYPFMEFVFKTVPEKGHLVSMQKIFDAVKSRRPRYWMHLEDDWLFFSPRNYIGDSIDILERYADMQQLLFNRCYSETPDAGYGWTGGRVIEPGVRLHVKDEPHSSCGYWPHFSLRPSVMKADAMLAVGDFATCKDTFFEREYADRYWALGYRSAYMDEVACSHTGRLTSEISSDKPNAYSLNGTDQFHPSTYVINLERRSDRRESMIEKIRVAGIKDYEFYRAIDGRELQLQPTDEMRHLFFNNDFGSRIGVVGCALTHLALWRQLVKDKSPRYLILEDDVTFSAGFQSRLTEVYDHLSGHRADLVLLGCFHHPSPPESDSGEDPGGLTVLNTNTYVGGFFSYIITLDGARKLTEYIDNHGIKHGIDFLLKIVPGLQILEVRPHIASSVWVVDETQDSDIQCVSESIDLRLSDVPDFAFYPSADKVGQDIKRIDGAIARLLDEARRTPECKAVNTLGFLKKGPIESLSLTRLSAPHGIFVKRTRVKMMCNWCDSKTLCRDWGRMTEDGTCYKNLQIVADGEADYNVIINMPGHGDSTFEADRTLVFQFEPWCETGGNWGVKTWGEWADPDPGRFLHVHTTRLNRFTPAYWQLEMTYKELLDTVVSKSVNRVATICSSKYYDPGHILRLDFLKAKSSGLVDVYGREDIQKHGIANYKGPIRQKKDILLPYKYYFMAENGAEPYYATEKIWEPILAECLCFYWGCPNLDEILDPRAFVRLDLADIEGSERLMKQAIEENWWEQRLPYIRQAKQKILKELQFFSVLEKLLPTPF